MTAGLFFRSQGSTYASKGVVGTYGSALAKWYEFDSETALARDDGWL